MVAVNRCSKHLLEQTSITRLFTACGWLAVVGHTPSRSLRLKSESQIYRCEQNEKHGSVADSLALRGSGIELVIHGHKHEHAADFEHIYDAGGNDHRTLVIRVRPSTLHANSMPHG
jgi:hypothetical protein